jgi:hypothetical protein
MYNLPVGIPLPTLPSYLPISILVADLCTFFVTSFFLSFLLLVCYVSREGNTYGIRDSSLACGVFPDMSFSDGRRPVSERSRDLTHH